VTNWIDAVIAFGKRLDDDNPIGALAGIPVVQSKYVPQGSAFLMRGPIQGKRHTLLIMDDIMATSTAQVRVNVYGGPLHGRILLIPASSPRFITLPYPMPAGEMFASGRSNPDAFDKGEYTYELKSGANGRYLGFVEGHARSFTIPVIAPSVRISGDSLNLVRNLREAAFVYGDERTEKSTASTMNTIYGKLTAAEKALVERISTLEQAAGIYRNQQVRY
jgi:hypothetical protein